MANQQLVDYISAQRAKGVSRDAINAALIGAGWSQADVSAAMDAVFSTVTSSAATMPGAMTMPGTVRSTTPVGSSTGPVSFQAKPSTPTTSPSFSSSLPASFTTPRSTPVTSIDVTSVEHEHHLSKPLMATVVVVVLLVIGGLAYWYFGGGAATPVIPGAADQATVDRLTQSNTELQGQIAQLNDRVANAETQLSIFAATTTREVPLTIRGTLQEATSTKIFTLTTDHNIILTVSNSKDAKVVSTLTPLLGMTVELTGTHPPVSAQLKVTAVNGVTLAPPVVTTSTTSTPSSGAPAAPSSPTTSTTP